MVVASMLPAVQHCHPTTVRRAPAVRAAALPAARFASSQSSLVRTTLGSGYLSGTQLAYLPRRSSSTACGALGLEMNIFGRLARVFRSYANAVVNRAEDPEKMLEQTVTEMQEDVIKMRQASAQVLASQKQMSVKYESARSTAEDWLRRAQLAVEKGDDELAREALKRKKTYEDAAKNMKLQLDQQQKAVDTLVANTRMLESKLTEAKSKKDTLKARAKSAQSAKMITEMVQGLNTSNAASAFDRMEEKVMALEAESEATLQLVGGDELERKFVNLEGDDVDAELRALKSGTLKSASTTKASLPAGRPIRDAIDFELEELRRKASS